MVVGLLRGFLVGFGSEDSLSFCLNFHAFLCPCLVLAVRLTGLSYITMAIALIMGSFLVSDRG